MVETCPCVLRWNWNLKVLVFKKRGKPEYPERTPGKEPTKKSTRIWHTFEPGPDHMEPKPMVELHAF